MKHKYVSDRAYGMFGLAGSRNVYSNYLNLTDIVKGNGMWFKDNELRRLFREYDQFRLNFWKDVYVPSTTRSPHGLQLSVSSHLPVNDINWMPPRIFFYEDKDGQVGSEGKPSFDHIRRHGVPKPVWSPFKICQKPV